MKNKENKKQNNKENKITILNNFDNNFVKKQDHYFQPNYLESRNVVWRTDRVWVSDIFDCMFVLSKKSTRIGVCFIMDIAYNEILSIKAFHKKIKKGSLKSKLICKLFSNLLNQIKVDDRGLIIHTDRGAEYSSSEFINLIKNYPNVILSHSNKGMPKQNAVAERMVRTLKHQIMTVVNKQTTFSSIKDVQKLFQDKANFYNQEHKIAKAMFITPQDGRRADEEYQNDEPTYALAFNHPMHAPAVEIVEKKINKIKAYKDRNVEQKIDTIEGGVFRAQAMISCFRNEVGNSLNEVNTSLQEINEKVTPKEKRFHKHLPLRDPATGTIYQFLMNKKKKANERTESFYSFRIAITLLKHTGLRVNEIKDFTKQDILEFMETERLQVYQGKQNRHREIILSDKAAQDLRELKAEINYLFLKRTTLSDESTETSWIRFINRRLKETAKAFKLSLKSHSFRIDRVTSLLKIAPAQKVMKLIGHNDIRSTMAYSRYDLDKKEAKKLFNQADSLHLE